MASLALVDDFPIKIVMKSGETTELVTNKHCKIGVLKWKIRNETGIYPTEQRLFFEGIELNEPEYTLECYGIVPSGSSADPPVEYRIHLMPAFKGIPQTYFLDEAHYDPRWNCSFEGLREKHRHSRGGRDYIRPIGCVRYGVKVLGKYGDDRWLGSKGLRTDGEWPVAYHGTKELNVLEILRHGFLLERGIRFAYGRGIYCTPDPQTAQQYAFNYAFNGEQYKLIIQCRVDPARLQIVAKNSLSPRGDYWLVPDGSAIRPYGICVYRCN